MFYGFEVWNKDDLQVLRVKVIYENLVRMKTGRYVSYSIDKSTAKGKRTYERFLWLVTKCQELGISPHEYLTVLFQPPLSGVETKWSYPYLSFVASNRGVEIYRYRRERIDKSFAGVRRDVSGLSPLSFENSFVNCFVGGVRLLSAMDEKDLQYVVESFDNIFAFFLAFSDVFTPEFVATHSAYSLYMIDNPQDDVDLKRSVELYTADVVKRMNDKVYKDRLLRSRQKVMEDELAVVKLQIANWERLWKILV